MVEYDHEEGSASWEKGDRFPVHMIQDTKWYSEGLVEALQENGFIDKPKSGWSKVKKEFLLMDKLDKGRGFIQYEDGKLPGASFIYFGGEEDGKKEETETSDNEDSSIQQAEEETNDGRDNNHDQDKPSGEDKVDIGSPIQKES